MRESYRKKGGIADKIERNTNLSMRKFCELHKLSYQSLRKGYVSKTSREVLAKFNIKVV